MEARSRRSSREPRHPHPHPNPTPTAAGARGGRRVRGGSPTPAAWSAWPCPPRARAASNGHAGRERASAFARAPRRSRGLGAPRGPLASFSRLPCPPRAGEAFLAWSSGYGPRLGGDLEGFYLGMGTALKRDNSLGPQSRSAAPWLCRSKE